ncbi:carboxypeptidase-like regulatory domain-containing protein [Pedobacter terrae]|uniref:carboxypeptidase-like regulatory domain-containing protein n=1 Tax=Pedobacter terrae TaxID=405671 RepID=UPI002FFBC44E
MFTNFKSIAFILLLFITQQLFAQNATITGTVKSADGETLPGVSILIKETKQTAITDGKGAFSISVPEKGTLVFSYIGFKSQEIQISKSGPISVILQSSDNALDEVVVTALGISREKKSLGYAVQELKGDRVAEAKESNLVNALAGKIAGVRVTNSQGSMGSSRVVIRGRNLYSRK